MASPFPGMDPYLESHWGDVHSRLVVYASDQLQAQMPAGLRVWVDEYITVEPAENVNGAAGGTHHYGPDVRVVDFPGSGSPQQLSATSGVQLAQPLVVPLHLSTMVQRTVRVKDTRSGNRVVTAIEFLSRANKVGDSGRTAYQQKQKNLLKGEVNLVEIDLLREGGYLLAAPSDVLPADYLAPYRICVVRASKPGQAETYRVSLRERLPTIAIPLRSSDPDAHLNIQELVDKVYVNGGYDGVLDYRVDPQPPLQGDDAVWADQMLHERGCR